MAFTSGTATDYHDLLDQVRIWMTGTAGWTQLRWNNPAGMTSVWELSLMGPGAGPDRRVYAHIRTQADAPNSHYCWQLDASVAWDSGVTTWLGQQGSAGKDIYSSLWQNTIDYWIYANERRFIVVAKMSTIYTSLHVGFFLPWGTPEEYPFPLYVAGDRLTMGTYNNADAGHRFFIDPAGGTSSGAAWVRSPVGAWRVVSNQNEGTGTDNGSSWDASNRASLWPHYTGARGNSSGIHNWSGSWDNTAGGGSLDALVPTAQGERYIVPCTLVEPNSYQLGVLDGVYVAFGRGLTTEQLLTAGGKDLRAFQNIARSSGNDFVLIEEAA